jgi:two-component system sensor histidine kinase KdpD
MDRTAKAEELLRELGGRARLVVYVASAPGSGKTRRLLEDARRLAADGKRVLIGWIETKGRPDLERLAESLPRVPPRRVTIGDATFEDFDYEAALSEMPLMPSVGKMRLRLKNMGSASSPPSTSRTSKP